MTSSKLYFAICTVYELYKMDWMHRISETREMDNVKTYFEELIDSKDGTGSYGFVGVGYGDWLKERGFDGELYVSFREFCDNELQDKEYIRELIAGCEPLAEYIEAYWEGKDKGYGEV